MAVLTMEVAEHIAKAERLIKNYERWNGEESRELMVAHYSGVMLEAQAETNLALTKQLMILTDALFLIKD